MNKLLFLLLSTLIFSTLFEYTYSKPTTARKPRCAWYVPDTGCKIYHGAKAGYEAAEKVTKRLINACHGDQDCIKDLATRDPNYY